MFTTIQEVHTEDRTLRMLDTSHTLLAYPAFLAGYRTIHEAVADGCLNTYLRTSLTITNKSLINAPTNELEERIDQLMYHVASPEEDDSLVDVCRDGASKLATYILPALRDRLEQGKDVSSFAFLLAAYGQYLKAGVDDKEEQYTVDEPDLTPNDWKILTHGDELSLLDISAFAPAHLRSFPQFVTRYKSYSRQIASHGLIFSLKQTLCAFGEDDSPVSDR
ncbi:mannitol dehydrogenase family protein [Spirosoma aerophilum]